MPTETTICPHPLLVAAVAALTAVDGDRAAELNGIGWSATETFLGHRLAETDPAEWTPKATYWAWAITRKYVRQLSSVGIDWYDIPPVPAQEDAGMWHRERKEEREREERQRLRELDEEIRVFDAYEAHQRQRAAEERRKALDAQRAARPLAGRVIEQLGEGTVVVRYPFSYDTKDLVKATVPGIRFDADRKLWWAALTPLSLPGLVALHERHGFAYGPGVAERVAAMQGTARVLENGSAASDSDFAVAGLLRQPYPFQRAGIAYAVAAKRTFIADAPGLGKTIQSIATVWHLKTLPCVVVCPANVKFNWRREIEATLPGVKVAVLQGTKPPAVYPVADFYVLNYNIAPMHLPVLKATVAIKALIADEGHYMINEKAARTKAVMAMADKLDVRLILTGTAIVNRPIELLPQLKVLGRVADVAKNDWDFKSYFCGAYKDDWDHWHFDGARNIVELNQRLRRACYVRREKADVLKELPAKVRTVIPTEITNRAEYDRAESDFINWLVAEAEADEGFNATLEGLTPEEKRAARKAHGQGEAEKARAAEHLVRFAKLRKLAAQGKMAALIEWVEDFLASGQKLVVFAYHRETVLGLCKALEKVHGGRVPHIMGGDDALARQQTVDDFQQNPATRLLVCNIIAAGEGITLTAASDVLMCELWWNPGKLEQAEDRCHRIGQKDSVTAWYMLANETIEADVYETIWHKTIVTRGVNEGVEIGEDEIGVMHTLIAKLKGKRKK